MSEERAEPGRERPASAEGGDPPATAPGPGPGGAEWIRARRAGGPGLLSRLPGMAYQRRDDRGWTLEFASPGSTALTGLPPQALVGPAGTPLARLVHPDDLDRARDDAERAVAGGRSFDLEYRLRTADGRERWVWDRGHPIHDAEGALLAVEGFLTDVTDRKHLEEHLQQAQKLEALGELTASIAHDFNNLLTAIVAPLEVVLDRLEPSDPAVAELSDVHETALYAASLTQQLLAFSRRQVRLRRVVDLNAVLDGLTGTLERLVGDRVRLDLQTSGAPLPVRADPSQLEQVVVNLVVNARDAMSGGGRVRVRTGETIPEEDRSAAAGADPGDLVWLEVADDGPGVPAELRDRIFDPYFTTKDHGTGLGLATVFGIVSQNEGAVQLVSDVGEGARFKVTLPRVDAPLEPVQEPPQRARARAGGTGAVLLVEGDRRVREATAQALRRYGYTVLSADDAAEALEAARAHPVDVLLSDVLVDDGGAAALADRVRALRPDVRVVYMSGYADEVAARGVQADRAAALLPKPYTLPDLLSAVSGAVAPGVER